MEPTTLNESHLRRKAVEAGHSYIFDYWDELSRQQRFHLLEQVARVDFNQLNSLIALLKGPRLGPYGRIEPAPVVSLRDACGKVRLYRQYRSSGDP